MRAKVLRTSALAIGAVGLAKLLISCVDLESLGSGTRPDDGGAPDTFVSTPPEAAADPCTHDQPAATSTVSDGKDELPPFVLAISEITLDPARVTPFDLDGVCTCDGRPGALYDGGPRCATATVSCDGDGGADNGLGALSALTAVGGGIAMVANRLITTGHRTVLLQIAGYNGLPNDDEVRVGTLLGAGIHEKGCASSTLDGTTGLYSAGLCGDDPWAIPPGAIVGGVPLVVGAGYVREGRLVARLNNAVLLPFTDQSTLNFQKPIITGTLVPVNEALQPRDPRATPTEKEKRLFLLQNATLAGRVQAGEGVAAIGTYVQSSTGKPLCTSAAFGLIHDQLCGASDIQGKPLVPDDPARACDAISAAIGLAAVPAVMSFVSDAGPLPTGCEGVDAALVTCP